MRVGVCNDHFIKYLLGRLFHLWFHFHFPHRSAIGMSALPLKADMCGVTAYVCFGSKADICSAQAHVCYGPKADVIRAESELNLGCDSGAVGPSPLAMLLDDDVTD